MQKYNIRCESLEGVPETIIYHDCILASRPLLGYSMVFYYGDNGMIRTSEVTVIIEFLDHIEVQTRDSRYTIRKV